VSLKKQLIYTQLVCAFLSLVCFGYTDTLFGNVCWASTTIVWLLNAWMTHKGRTE